MGHPHDEQKPSEVKGEGVVRIWVDGCFDMHHFGHANLLRQAASLGDELYVGIHTDEEIVKAKGCAPLMNAEERYACVRACKWVTAVVEAAPYVTVRTDMEKYKIDYVVHGDDVCVTIDGTHAYEAVQDMFKVVRRTFGISTTDIMNRCLQIPVDGTDTHTEPLLSQFADPKSDSKFLTTSRKIQQFSAGNRAPTLEDKIIYVDGDFDLFHIGHVNFLKEAKKHGTYLIVGVHTDEVVQSRKGPLLPILPLNERVLCVLQCRYVNEVIIGVPYDVTELLLEEMNVSVVCAGDPSTRTNSGCPESAYEVPKNLGKFACVNSGSPLTTKDLIKRVQVRKQEIEERNAKKAIKDKDSQSGPRVGEIA